MTTHADDSLRDRGIEVWQLLGEIQTGKLLSERPRDVPNPSIEVNQLLPDGTPVKVVWAYVKIHSLALLVTVHFYDQP